MPAFTDEINYGPMLLALLQMPEVQISQLAASKSAPQQDGENRPIPFPLRVSASGDCHRRLAFSAVSQFPSETRLQSLVKSNELWWFQVIAIALVLASLLISIEMW